MAIRRWIIGETVDTLSKDRAHIVHTEEPRFIATLISDSGIIHFTIDWSESPIPPEQLAQFKNEAIRAFLEYNQVAQQYPHLNIKPRDN